MGQRPRGSKKPKGLDTPGSFMGLKTEDGEEDEAWTVVVYVGRCVCRCVSFVMMMENCVFDFLFFYHP